MSTRNTLSMGYRGSSLGGNPHPYGIPNTCAEPKMINNLYGHSNTNVGNVSNIYNKIVNVGVDEGSLRIRALLPPLETHGGNQDVRNHRLDGVGDWFLQRNGLDSWHNGQDCSVNPTLLFYGGQGVGNTCIGYDIRVTLKELCTMLTGNNISSLVIDTLRDHTRGQNIAVVSLPRKDQLAVHMIGALLRQIVLGAARIPGEIQSAFEESGKGGGQSPWLPDMVKLFVKAINSVQRVYICVDTVDELLPQDRLEFLRALRQIIQDAPGAQLFLTGRPYICGGLDKHLTNSAYTIQFVTDQGGVARYVSRKIDDDDDDDQDPGLMTENLKNDIMKTILEKASAM